VQRLQTTLFVILMVVLTTQTFRHVWVKWIEPKGSVLDEFQRPVEKDLAETKSLDELKAMYAKARANLKSYEAGKSLEEIALARETDRETYQDERQIEEAIRKVEGQERTMFQVCFYWGCGLISVLLGLFAMSRIDPWVGVVGLITGFGEMAIVTNPLYRTWGPQAGFERLLTLKLVLSVLSLALLVFLWLRARRRTYLAT
jgi:hypothetical protein